MCTMLFILLLLSLVLAHLDAYSTAIEIITNKVLLVNVNFPLKVKFPELLNGSVYEKQLYTHVISERGTIVWNGTIDTLNPETGFFQSTFIYTIDQFSLTQTGWTSLTVVAHNSKGKEYTGTVELFATPGIFSLVPPIVTLIMSATLGNVIVALILGIWAGSTIVHHGNIFLGFLATFDTYWVNAFTSDGHSSVLLFTLMLGGTIGIVQKSGGGHGLAQGAKRFMTSRFRMQLCVWLLCLVIFFDDYSCILIIGNSLRGVLRDSGVSREKFAIIIHAIGVCLPSMAPVSAWIGVEIGYVTAQIEQLNLDLDPFVTCLRSIPYRFFPVLFIAFIFIIIIFERDFGPIVKCEEAAIAKKIELDQEMMTVESNSRVYSPLPSGPLDPKPETQLRWYNAVIPFGFIVVATFAWMIYGGFKALSMIPIDQRPPSTLLNALSHSDSVSALIKSSSSGCLIAMVMVIGQKLLSLAESMDAWIYGIKDILEPTVVLLLAWALGSVMVDVQAAAYLGSVVHRGLPPACLPAISTLLCYIVSFATGSGFGTMAIMMPIIVPLAFDISGGDEQNLLECIGGILGGSTFGNCCSPIGDTSVLASLSASIPLTKHVQTILPYSIVVAVVALLGILSVGLNILSTFVAYAICFACLIFVVIVWGKNVEKEYRSRFNSAFTSFDSPLESQQLLKK